MLSELNLNDNNELIQKDTVLEKQMVRKDPEIEHSVDYKKHYYELFGEITDLILTTLIKGTKNSLNNHFSKW